MMNWITYISMACNVVLTITAIISIRYIIINRNDEKKDKDSQAIKELTQIIEDNKKQISEQREQLELKKRLVMRQNLTYYKQDSGEEVIVCPNCIKEKVFPLPMFKNRYSNQYHCNGCGYDIGLDGSEVPIHYPPNPVSGFGEEITII